MVNDVAYHADSRHNPGGALHTGRKRTQLDNNDAGHQSADRSESCAGRRSDIPVDDRAVAAESRAGQGVDHDDAGDRERLGRETCALTAVGALLIVIVPVASDFSNHCCRETNEVYRKHTVLMATMSASMIGSVAGLLMGI